MVWTALEVGMQLGTAAGAAAVGCKGAQAAAGAAGAAVGSLKVVAGLSVG